MQAAAAAAGVMRVRRAAGRARAARAAGTACSAGGGRRRPRQSAGVPGGGRRGSRASGRAAAAPRRRAGARTVSAARPAPTACGPKDRQTGGGEVAGKSWDGPEPSAPAACHHAHLMPALPVPVKSRLSCGGRERRLARLRGGGATSSGSLMEGAGVVKDQNPATPPRVRGPGVAGPSGGRAFEGRRGPGGAGARGRGGSRLQPARPAPARAHTVGLGHLLHERARAVLHTARLRVAPAGKGIEVGDLTRPHCRPTLPHSPGPLTAPGRPARRPAQPPPPSPFPAAPGGSGSEASGRG